MSPTKDEINDIFGIDIKNSSSIGDEDAIYDEVKTSTENSSFERKNQELKNILKEAAIEEKVETPKEEPKIIVNSGIDETTEIDYDKEIERIREEQELSKPVQVDLQKEEQDFVKALHEETPKQPVKENVQVDNEEVEEKSLISISTSIKLNDWNLDSPSPNFDRFYIEKRKTLDYLMDGEDKKTINKYKKELRSAAVDTSIPSYDGAIIMDRIREVQGWRDRVSQIQKECNYIRWEMAMDMLKGLLARVIYLKPAAKQPGVIYEHLGDMELYFASLKETYHNAEIVNKNLTNAYESLSRQVAIVQPHLDKVVYEKRLPNPYEAGSTSLQAPKVEKKKEEVLVIPDQLKDFDELIDTKIEEVVKEEINLENAAKEISWGDL